MAICSPLQTTSTAKYLNQAHSYSVPVVCLLKSLPSGARACKRGKD